MTTDLKAIIEGVAADSGEIVFLTGAGISAESGIPTFRGEEGYWVVGAREFRPQEMATRTAFDAMPIEVWRWYLYRRGVCRRADPNRAHLALVDLEAALGDDFVLVTQNVDGLHLRAGQSIERTYQVHGNIDYMRCAEACSTELAPLDDSVPLLAKDEPLTADVEATLRCGRCGAQTRPHVLWFDECYDEPLFRFESSLAAVTTAKLLVTVGTTGQTNLPSQMVTAAHQRGIPIIDINPDRNAFSEVAEASGGMWIAESSGDAVPGLALALARARPR